MSQENEEMRPEYDIRGGTRGKYFGKYVKSATLRIEDAPWIQPQMNESQGKHESQSTIQIGAEPIYLTPCLEVGEPAQR
jgi:hypothetical protein